MQRFLLAAFIAGFGFFSCKKSGESPPPPPPPENKHILTSLRIVSGTDESALNFEFGPDGKPSRAVRYYQGVATVDSFVFKYNEKKQLTRIITYDNSVTTPWETNKFIYNASGQLIADSSYDDKGYNCWHCYFTYEYDNKGRLSKYTSGSSFYRRYEYGAAGNNPVKTYMKPFSAQNEALEYEFLEYDQKKSVYGADSVMRIILPYFFRGNEVEYPAPSMINNVIKMKLHPHPYPNVLDIMQNINQQYEYNADGYPTKVIMSYSPRFSGSDPYSRTIYFTYQKLN
jgi:hypothetical protein